MTKHHRRMETPNSRTGNMQMSFASANQSSQKLRRCPKRRYPNANLWKSLRRWIIFFFSADTRGVSFFDNKAQGFRCGIYLVCSHRKSRSISNCLKYIMTVTCGLETSLEKLDLNKKNTQIHTLTIKNGNLQCLC